MSKIQSESNSQLTPEYIVDRKGCDRYVKDTIWKQFTTWHLNAAYRLGLWSVCQRYNLKAIHNSANGRYTNAEVVIGMSKIQSESNSQQKQYNKTNLPCCDRYVKDTIWKQFTTPNSSFAARFQLWSVCQRYNLKAIHNYALFHYRRYPLWSVCQRYNLKAIHNIRSAISRIVMVVIGMSKIQSESNSQLSNEI